MVYEQSRTASGIKTGDDSLAQGEAEKRCLTTLPMLLKTYKVVILN